VQTVQLIASASGTRYSASIEPGTEIPMAFRASGYVESLAVASGRPIDAGDRVIAGQVLARVRPADVDEQVNRARAQLAEAQAGRGAAQATFERARQLYEERSLTRPEFEEAQAALEAMQARVDGAQAMVRSAEIVGADTALRSPLDGIVLARRVEVGSLVAPGTVAFVVADVTRVKAVFGAPDTLVGSLRIGSAVPVTVEAVPGRSFQGRISRIAPVADPLTRIFDVELTMDNADRALRPGMIASVAIAADQASPPTILLPISAIVRASPGVDAYAVFVLENAGGASVVRRREVSLGHLVGNRVEVPSGLSPGEQVVVNGASVVVDGDIVTVVR
jgi:multidrug efflux system membrane fusion protein